jgi:hypothetical protein
MRACDVAFKASPGEVSAVKIANRCKSGGLRDAKST